MFGPIWVALILIAASENCATDACLWANHTITVPAESESECRAIVAQFQVSEDVTFADCKEFAIPDDMEKE